MKRLLFVIAGAAAFSAFAADPTTGGSGDISWVGFENYTVNQTVVGYGDDGNTAGGVWTCAGDDASLVKAYSGGEVAAPSNMTVPALFAEEANNTQYLALDTNGSELQRAIPFAGQLDAGTYIDTLVQFTPSESDPTSTDLTGAKLAIWLKADSVNNTTNLYVQGGYLVGPESDGDVSIDTAATRAYKLSNIAVEAGQWYRLTVKSVVLDNDGLRKVSGFQVYVDGTLAVSDAAVCDANAVSFYESISGQSGVLDGVVGLLNAKTIIPTCAGITAGPTLTSVGFKGTGAIDDFVVTTEAPAFGPAPVDFTLTWPAGLTAVSYQIGEGEPVAISGNSPFAVPGLAAGDVVKFIVANADGAQKTLTGTVGTDAGLDATGTTFGWPEYLGEAVNGAYEIDNLAELKLFQKGIAITTNELKLATAGETFKLTADIALDEAWPGIGVQNGKDIYSTADFNAAAFQGTFDGQNHTISGFQMIGKGDKAEGLDYCGFFNSAYGATIQNLKIAYAGSLFAADTTKSTKESGATFVGVAKNSTLDNLTTVAGTVSCSKGFGGIVGYLTSGTTVQNCTNNVNMTSLAPNKCGGIAMITQGGSAVTISNCQNNGTIAGSGETGSLVGFVGLDTTFTDCDSTVAYRLFHHNSGTVTVSGITADATVDSYSGAVTPGLNFATVDNGVATFVADDALAASNTYKAMHAATATYEFAAAGSISFNTNMIQAVTFNVTSGAGLEAPTSATANGVVTFTAVATPATVNVTVTGGANATAVWTVNGSVVSAPATLTEGDSYSVTFTADQGYEFAQGATTVFSGTVGTEDITIVAPDASAPAGWVDDSSTVSNQTAATTYPALGGTALAAADSVELTDWAKFNKVEFADVLAAPGDYVDAFLLNCAVADVDTEKEAFKATITVGADGTITVTTPDGKDYNGTLQMKGSNDLSTWTPVEGASSSYHFYKFELGL